MKITITINQTGEGRPFPIDEQREALDHVIKQICEGYRQGEVYFDPNSGEDHNIEFWWELQIEEE